MKTGNSLRKSDHCKMMACTSNQTFKCVILTQYIHSKWKKLIDRYNLMTAPEIQMLQTRETVEVLPECLRDIIFKFSASHIHGSYVEYKYSCLLYNCIVTRCTNRLISLLDKKSLHTCHHTNCIQGKYVTQDSRIRQLVANDLQCCLK